MKTYVKQRDRQTERQADIAVVPFTDIHCVVVLMLKIKDRQTDRQTDRKIVIFELLLYQ